MGLWIFHHLLGGGCLNTPPPSISAPAHCRTKRKTALERSRKIISKSFRSFFGSGQNWGHQGSKFQNFPKRFFDDTIFNFKGRTTILIPSCLSRRTMYSLTLKGQGPNLTSGQVRARSPGDPSMSNYTSFDAPCWDKRNDSNPTSLAHLVLKLLTKNFGDLEWPPWILEGSLTKNFTWSINKYLTWCDSIHISSRWSIKQGV